MINRDCDIKKPWLRIVTIAVFSCAFFGNAWASFIETTIGTAVVNDATASYFNPAALLLLKNAQVIPLMTVIQDKATFSGQVTTLASGITQFGRTPATTRYYAPSFYVGIPLNKKITLGFAAISHFVNRDVDEDSVLRYIQASSAIRDDDLTPAIGVRFNQYISIGAGINFYRTRIDTSPIIGFPGSGIPDANGRNETIGSGIGGNVGFLLEPREGTRIGFNYRLEAIYNQSGTSQIGGPTPITSTNYAFQLKIPARAILTWSQKVTPKAGLVMTVQHFDWSSIRVTPVRGVATLMGTTPVILNGVNPQYLRDTWLLTLGGNYRFKPDWVIRVAGTYNESPGNDSYQITYGNNYILGASLGHDVNKFLTVDVGYAHAFIQDESVHVNGSRFLINGNNSAFRNGVSLKFTVNAV